MTQDGPSVLMEDYYSFHEPDSSTALLDFTKDDAEHIRTGDDGWPSNQAGKRTDISEQQPINKQSSGHHNATRGYLGTGNLSFRTLNCTKT